MTPAWIEQANRIKRRITTNGGADDGLAKHMVKFLSKHLPVVEVIIDTLAPDTVQEEVKRLSFYKNDTFEFIWDYHTPTEDSYTVEKVVIQELPNALNSLSQQSPRKWFTPLGEMVPEVMKVLLCRTIKNRPVLVLELTSRHPLGKSTCYIQGYIPKE